MSRQPNAHPKRWVRKMKVRKQNGVTVLGIPEKVNKIVRERDNTDDLEAKVLRAKSKRKFTAPDSSTPGRKVSAPPFSETSLPS